MQRLFTLALVVALVVGAVVLAAGDGPNAFTVANHEVSQSEVDAELEALAGNPEFAAGLVGQEVLAAKASVPSNLSAGWLSFRIVTTYAIDELSRRGERVTADDRAATGLARVPSFSELPPEMRARLSHGFASLRALQRSLEDDPSGSVQDAVLSACPSARFVSHILVETEAEVSAIAAELAGGADFAELAVERSTDPGSAEVGGQLGCLDELGDAVAPFLAAAEAAQVGVVSGPVATEFGFHLILVTDTPAQTDLDAASIAVVLRRIGRVPIELDPRYGRWDAATAQVLQAATTAAG
ncbi:MAG: peptidylprolyl isomerase [Acidimicrobiia bacterium]